MRSQTTCSVSLFSSVHILTVGLRGVGLSEVDYYYFIVNQLYHLKIILTVNINFVLQDIVERKSCESEISSNVANDRFLLLYQLLR